MRWKSWYWVIIYVLLWRQNLRELWRDIHKSLYLPCSSVIQFGFLRSCDRPCIVTNFFIIKPTRCTNFTNLFWHETLHVSDSSYVHHQEFIHSTFSNGICRTAFEQDQAWPCSKAVYKPVWHTRILLLHSAQWINSWWWTDELYETCRVSCQNKFVELLHLVCFIIKKSIGFICLFIYLFMSLTAGRVSVTDNQKEPSYDKIPIMRQNATRITVNTRTVYKRTKWKEMR
jgi:hypothetical protein